MRADVNVSVRKHGEEGYRPRWELKNMNSFTFIGRGIEAAVREQIAAYERGETIEQSTYDYDPDTDRLTVHRSKEEADDYRYFPEPDLVPIEPSAELVERLRAELPSETLAARINWICEYVGFDDAYTLVMTGRDRVWVDSLDFDVDPRAAANILLNEGADLDPLKVDSRAFAEVVKRRARLPRQVLLAALSATASAPESVAKIIEETSVSDASQLDPVIEAVLAANPDQVATYRGGKEGVLGFLVGQVMKETQGKADAKVVNALLREKLTQDA
jgi:aspartyl-tRNA(Asn)/glutamyl-tRNA(Gln) amidotransferase subunit B